MDEALSRHFLDRKDMRVHQKNRFPTSFVWFPKEAIDQSITQLFEQMVRERPGNLAVKFGDHSVTYNELNQTANHLARKLPKSDSGRLMAVALFMEQGITLIASILAVLKAGLSYAPMDRRQPKALLEKTLEDLQPSAFLADDRNFHIAEAMAHPSCAAINAEAIESSLSGENLDLVISPDTAAYVFYTSGSTGDPKGVIDSHRNVLHNVMRYTNTLGFSPEDRMSLVQHSSFSGTVSTLFGSLLNGAAVFPFDLDRDRLNSIATWARRERVTIFHSVPSIFRQLAENFRPYPELRLIRLEGDSTTVRDINIFQDTFADNCILVNGLGATECGLVRQYFVDKQTNISGGGVPVGYRVEDMEVRVVDESSNDTPPGSIGEIVIESPYLALGYLRKPELTGAKFKQHILNSRTYYTGDLGCISQDGCLRHLGRKDFQIKIGGNSVDIMDVEHVLSEIDTVEEAVVHPYTDRMGEHRLVTYLVPHKGSQPVVSDIREYLKTRLPGYMIPATFEFLGQLPLTPDGKVNRHCLPGLTGTRPLLGTEFVAPETPMERLLATVWAEVLGLDSEQIGVLDSFFDLGGDSLRATQVINRLRERIDKEMEVATMFKYWTIRSLLQHLDSDSVPEVDLLSRIAERAVKQRAMLARIKRNHQPKRVKKA